MFIPVTVHLVSDEHYERIAQKTQTFAEQFVESLAEQSTKSLENVSNDVKKVVTSFIDDYYYYTGKVVEIRLDRDFIVISKEDSKVENLLYVPFAIYTLEGLHPLNEAPILDEYNRQFDIGFTFSNNHWEITSLNTDFYWDFSEADSFLGKEKLYGPSEEAVKSATSKLIETRLEGFLLYYTESVVEAINYRDFSLVEDYISPDGPRYNEAKDYIDYLDSKGIYEDFNGFELDKVKELSETSWEVTYIEKYDIYSDDDMKSRTFRTNVIIKEIDNGLYVDELVSTTILD